MRIVVTSDSHGNRWNLFEILKKEPSAEVFYFLGDGQREYYELASAHNDKTAFIGVNGNCDFSSDLPNNDVRTINSKKIYATHGYMEKVKFGLWGLEEKATKEKYDIVLFGHTHQPFNLYKDGIYYFNPGSVRDGFYGVVDITENGVMCIHKNLITY